jgi:hypothetical protein
MNMFIAEYNSTGDILYIKSAASAANMGRSYGQKIGCGINDNIYVLGGFFEMLWDTFYLAPQGSPYNDPQFLTMVDKYGVVHWLSSFGGFTYETTDFSLDAAGCVYTTGNWNWTSDAHLWVSKFDLTGHQVWSTTMDRGYPCYLVAGGIAVNGDYLYASAHAELSYYDGNGNLNGGLYLLLAKHDTSGAVLSIDTIPTHGSWHPRALNYQANGNYFLIDGMYYANGNPVTCSITLGNDSITSFDGNLFIAKFTDGVVTSQSVIQNPQSEISIFPNPTHSTFTLHCPLSTINCQLKIYNSFGSLIHRQIITSANQEINLKEKPGVYFLEVDRIRQKLVVY